METMSVRVKILSVLFAMGMIYFYSESVLEKLPYSLRINYTNSLPEKLYISGPIGEIKRQDYVSFFHQQKEVPLLKKVLGLPGDKIEMRLDRIFVNEQDCGKVLTHSKSGLPLHAIHLEKVSEGHVFVGASHPESFDSRYEEFGLVKISAIREKLWPLF